MVQYFLFDAVKNIVDSFKGVFLEKKFDIDIKQVEEISRIRV